MNYLSVLTKIKYMENPSQNSMSFLEEHEQFTWTRNRLQMILGCTRKKKFLQICAHFPDITAHVRYNGLKKTHCSLKAQRALSNTIIGKLTDYDLTPYYQQIVFYKAADYIGLLYWPRPSFCINMTTRMAPKSINWTRQHRYLEVKL